MKSAPIKLLGFKCSSGDWWAGEDTLPYRTYRRRSGECRRGRRPRRPAGARCAPLRLKRVALITKTVPLIRLAALGTFPQGKAFGRPQGSPLRISKNGGRVWDPPLQKTKPFRACRRGRTLVGPPGNGRRLGRAAQCAAPTKKRERSGISVGAGPRPARGRTLCAPTHFPKRLAVLVPAPTKEKTVSGML